MLYVVCGGLSVTVRTESASSIRVALEGRIGEFGRIRGVTFVISGMGNGGLLDCDTWLRFSARL